MDFYDEFISYLDDENKEKALEFILNKLQNGDIQIVDLYNKVLAPALNNMECKLKDKRICIWKEHVRSSIIRTIIECCYPYVIKQRIRKDNGKKVVVVCPSEEYHEIGARMAADFFTLCGYNTIFVGSNTPKEDFLAAINEVNPYYIAVSITNYYNLVAAKKVIEKIKGEGNFKGKIFVGGYAFKNNKEAVKNVGADNLIDSFEDIKNLSKEEN